MRIVTAEELEARCDPSRAVAAVRQALLGGYSSATTSVAVRGRIDAHVAADQHGMAALVVGSGRSRDGAVLVLFDADGAPVAAYPADALRRVTAAASLVLAAGYLARPAAAVAVIGAGPLAETACVGLAAAGMLTDLRVYAPDAPARTRLAGAHHGRAAASVQDAVRDAGVVITATRSRDPVLRDDWLADGVFVAALGATRPDQRELDYRTLARASFVCTDELPDAMTRAADLAETVAAGHMEWLEVHELGQLVRGETDGRSAPADVTVYKPVGSAFLCAAVTGCVSVRP
jgi:ornithine cyclodeaminase/alanine dehydrogenase-like protein (mu-crystallin family)